MPASWLRCRLAGIIDDVEYATMGRLVNNRRLQDIRIETVTPILSHIDVTKWPKFSKPCHRCCSAVANAASRRRAFAAQLLTI
jgi:hypothetical protein